MAILIHDDVIQGTDEWLDLRRGILTASEMKKIITPKKLAMSSGAISHIHELAAQRISGYTEPAYISDDMMRGSIDEEYARKAYEEHKGISVDTCGFITNDNFGFTIGYSPDGLVGEYGLIEIKSRRQKYQIETVLSGGVPEEYMLQIQTGLIVSGRKWCDFISFSGGLPLYVFRVYQDVEIRDAIIQVAKEFNGLLNNAISEFGRKSEGMPKTERVIYEKEEEITC